MDNDKTSVLRYFDYILFYFIARFIRLPTSARIYYYLAQAFDFLAIRLLLIINSSSIVSDWDL